MNVEPILCAIFAISEIGFIVPRTLDTCVNEIILVEGVKYFSALARSRSPFSLVGIYLRFA